jgi:hypothetical protein
MPVSPRQIAPLVKKTVVVLWLATATFTAFAGIGTTFHFLVEMPRSPQLETRRAYPSAAGNQRVYVKQPELRWYDCLDYDLGTASLCGVSQLGL